LNSIRNLVVLAVDSACCLFHWYSFSVGSIEAVGSDEHNKQLGYPGLSHNQNTSIGSSPVLSEHDGRLILWSGNIDSLHRRRTAMVRLTTNPKEGQESAHKRPERSVLIPGEAGRFIGEHHIDASGTKCTHGNMKSAMKIGTSFSSILHSNPDTTHR